MGDGHTYVVIKMHLSCDDYARDVARWAKSSGLPIASTVVTDDIGTYAADETGDLSPAELKAIENDRQNGSPLAGPPPERYRAES